MDEHGSDYWAQPPRPTFRIEAIYQAWIWITRELSVWPIACLLVGLIYVVPVMALEMPLLMNPPRLPSRGASFWDLMFWNLYPPGPMAFLFLGSLAIGILLYPLTAGILYAALRRLRGEPIGVGDVFHLRGSYWALVGAGAMVQVINMVALALCFLPILLVGPLLMFVPLLVIDRRVGPWAAAKLSARTVWPQFWLAFAFLLLAGLASGIGELACCVGIIFTAPIQYLAIAIIYNDFFPPLQEETTAVQT